MLNFLKLLLTPEFFFSIIRISAPILFATLAAIVVEKAGFCNIGLEGDVYKRQASTSARRSSSARSSSSCRGPASRCC